jgi:hypothetical protein
VSKGKKSQFFVWSLSVALIIAVGCTVPKPKLQPENIYSLPEITYKNYTDVAVFVDLTRLPEAQQEPGIVSATESELEKRGFNILSHNGYVAFSLNKKIYPQEVGNKQLLTKIREELGKSAIIRVIVDVFVAQEKLVDPLRTVTPGIPGERGTGATSMDVALRDRRELVIDLSLSFSMIDTVTAETIWSCSLTCFQYKHEGNLEGFFQKAIAACLDTIPAH